MRNVFKIPPGAFVAWTWDDNLVFAQMHVPILEIPDNGRFVGVWMKKPSPEEVQEMVELTKAD
jgi:hypothetical protein